MKTAVFCVAVTLAFVLVSGAVRSGELPSAPNDTVRGSAALPQLTREQKLANIRVEGFSWKRAEGLSSKEGNSGPVMIARYTIYNDNPFPIKDVEMTCVHMSDDGTFLDTDRRTASGVGSKSCALVVNLEMGSSMNSQAKRANCVVTNFVNAE